LRELDLAWPVDPGFVPAMTTTSIKGIPGFDAVWNEARQDKSEQSYKVSYGEVKKALGALKATGGRISRAEAKHAASTFSYDPVMTQPARKEAIAFLQTVGTGKPLDSTTIEAIKAEFSLRAVDVFKMLAVPGRALTDLEQLPDSVQKAVANIHDDDADDDWGFAEVRKTTLAGQPVFIVHHGELGGSLDLEKVEIFSAAGKSIARGSVWDAMAGFSWN
jgi:hypothetical protein